MRGRVPVWLLLIVACGADPGPATQAQPEAWPIDGFLAHLPEDTSIVLRLPPAAECARRPEVFAQLMKALGHPADSAMTRFFRCASPEGIDATQGPGLALTAGGAWVHYLAATDKGALNRALQPHLGDLVLREERRWITLSRGGRGPGDLQGDPLPPGDLALRVRHHPLLAALAHPGDALELSATLGGAGLRFSGRLKPGPATDTASRLAAARAGTGGVLDYIPSGLGLRLETTLPPTVFASLLSGRIALHTGLRSDKDRVQLERLLREVLTGVDPESGLALGLDFFDGELSFVALGRVAPGPTSPILAKLRQRDRSSFGALVLDARDAPQGVTGWHAWVVEPEPRLEGLPETAWNLVGGLASGSDDEGGGLVLAYATWDGCFIAAGGPRADLLVRSVRRRLARGASLSAGSWALRDLRAGGEGDYVLGLVVAGAGLAALADSDREALRRLLGAGENAQAPTTLVVAGRHRDGMLLLEGLARY